MIIRVLILSFLLIPIITTSYAENSEEDRVVETFSVFWAEFRQAVLTEDKEKLISMTLFPFKTRGQMDSDPVVKHNKASFFSIFGQLLNQDPGLSGTPDTMQNIIRRTERGAGNVVAKHGKSARVGDFVFLKIKNCWFFEMAFVNRE